MASYKSEQGGTAACASGGFPRCSALPKGASGFAYPTEQLYAIGSTTMQTYVACIAQLFAAGVPSADGTQFTVIYAGAGSCAGVEGAFAPDSSSPPPISTLAKTAT